VDDHISRENVIVGMAAATTLNEIENICAPSITEDEIENEKGLIGKGNSAEIFAYTSSSGSFAEKQEGKRQAVKVYEFTRPKNEPRLINQRSVSDEEKSAVKEILYLK
jgi:hypothetical protein